MLDLASWSLQDLGRLGAFIGGLSALIGLIGKTVKNRVERWEEELAHPESLRKLRADLTDSKWRDAYRRTLRHALDTADWFFGPTRSLRAYGVCLAIALFYPIVFYLFTWTLGGPHTLGTLEVLPEGLSAMKRLALTASLVLCGYVIFVISEYSKEIGAWTSRTLAPIMLKLKANRLALVMMTIAALGVTTVTATAIAGTVDSATAVVGTLAVAGAAATVGTLAAAGATVVTSPAIIAILATAFVVFAFVATVGYGYFVQGGLFSADYTSGLIFLVILPSLNAALDAVSLGVSRWLGRKILEWDFHWPYMAVLAAVDAGFAVIFLSSLAVALGVAGGALDQLAVLTTGNPVLNLDLMITQAASDPLGDGLWITAMLLSTLVPTMIHATVAIGSIFQVRGRKAQREKWLKELDEALGANEGLDPRARHRIARHWVWCWIPAVLIVVGLAILAGFGWQTSFLSEWLLDAVNLGRLLVG